MNLSNLTSLTLLNEQPDPPILEPTRWPVIFAATFATVATIYLTWSGVLFG